MRSFSKVKKWCKRIGYAGESAAADMLRYKGCEVLLRNCRTPKGEIDIIARDGVTLVFVEVKTLFTRSLSEKRAYRPLNNLSIEQKKRIVRAGLSYLRSLGKYGIRYRYDIVEVLYLPAGPGSIRHHIGAFGYDTVFRTRTRYR